MRPKDRMGILSLLAAGLVLIVSGCGGATARRSKVGAPPPLDLVPGERTITIAADRSVGQCYRFWKVGNFNKPYLLLDRKSVEEYRDMAPRVVELNCVYLLGGRDEEHNRWFLGVGEDGKIRTDFTGMIAQLNGALKTGYIPRIVLDNVPYNMSDPPQQSFYGNTAPPKDERIWHQYVQAAVQAMVEAFGPERVGTWWFRVGTEPDLKPGHWAGTREQYLAHYDYTVDAVTQVLPQAKIGPGNILNPARRRSGRRGREKWGLDIIDHIATGTNACTGRKGTRMTVFSCSWYTRVGRPVSLFDKAIGAIRERLNRYPQFADVIVEVGEFAVLGDENRRRLYAGDTTEWSASFYAALADRVYAIDVKQLYEWDHATYGVFHPRGRVIDMLTRMVGGRRLAVSVQKQTESAANCGAIACRRDENLFVLLYNHRPHRRAKVTEKVHLVIQDPRMTAGDAWRLSEWTIDKDWGVWAYAFKADCEAAGVKPLPKAGLYEGSVERLYGQPGIEVFRRNADRYARLAVVPKTIDNLSVSVGDRQLTLDLELSGPSVRLIRLSQEQ
jgi:xylan 1,4-beta-xylosidase